MKSIRGRLMTLLLAGLTLALGAGGAAVYWIAESNLVGQFDAGLKSRAHAIAALVKVEPEGLIFESGDAPPAVMAETYFELRVGSTGKLLKRSSNLGEGMLPVREVGVGADAIDDAMLPGALNGRAVWLGFLPRVDQDDWAHGDTSQANPEALIIAAAMDRGPIDRALGTLLTTLLIVGLSGAVVVGVVVALGVRWGLAPLERLSRELSGVAGITLRERLEGAGVPRELAPIYRELNALLDRVARTLERERAFADGAAHELRTPLAELRATAEVAIKWPDAKPMAESLTQVLQIGGEMEQLVESLVLISRGGCAGEGGAARQNSTGSIVQAQLDKARNRIGQKCLELDVELGNGVAFTAPPAAIEIITRNLIENAVHYTPHGGRVTIKVEHNGGGQALLLVENGPVQLREGDLSRLFEPFWRLDKARSDRRHVGLGLTVVHRIASAIGMHIQTALSGDQLQIRVCGAARPAEGGSAGSPRVISSVT